MDTSTVIIAMGASQTFFDSPFGQVTTLVGIAMLSICGMFFYSTSKESKTTFSIGASITSIAVIALLIEEGDYVLAVTFTISLLNYVWLRHSFNARLKRPKKKYIVQLPFVVMDIGVVIIYSSSFFFWFNELNIGQFILSAGVVIYLVSRIMHSSQKKYPLSS
jgi:NADH:ubiquinone oxidoreductase subunit 3 (subunit A)